MATAFGANDFLHSANSPGSTSDETGAFTPEQWSNEVIAPYKASRILAGLVTRWNFVGQYGDTIHVPTFVRPTAGAQTKSAEKVVTPQTSISTLTDILIDKHIEYTVLIDKFAEVQAMPSMRRAYVDDAGYAISRKIDWDLHLLARGTATPTAVAVGGDVPGAEYSDAVIGSDGTTAWAPAGAGNAAALADAGIRRMLRTMDDNNVPMEGRAFIIPPVELESLRGIARFTEQAFTGEAGGSNVIRTGLMGDLYGAPVYVTSNCPNVLDGGAANDQRAGMLLHKAAFVLVEQQRIEAVNAFLSEFLSTQLTWHTIYGVKEVRSENVIPFIVPA